MAIIRIYARRWLRRNRSFFVIGFLIIAVQIYLAYKSFAIHDKPQRVHPETHTFLDEIENGGVSARKNKDGLIDDEDIQINSNNINSLTKPKTESVKVSLLKLDELDFIPSCDITTKEAISAIHRAKTQRCKQQLANITCLIQGGKFYPTTLPNSCPQGEYKANKPLGCYKDEKTFRLLSGYYANYKTNNSPKHCIRMCLQSGFPYAGVQYATECFCGTTALPSAAKLPDSSCNMKCPGDARQVCGGYFTLNAYETGIGKFSAQVAETSLSSTDKPVRIAFLLTLNGRALRQVYRLIKILFHADHYFYIHVDSRQDYLFRELLSLEKRFPNIKLSRKRFSTIWGGASLLQMLLVCMSELLDAEWKWDFVINLSESDFPVKTNNKLVEFLTANRHRNFVKSHGREVQRFIQKQGLDKTFVECDTHMWRTGDRVLPWGIQIDGGSDWVTLSREFVQYVANKRPDELVEGLLKIFQHTLLPAESFFHTVLRNSHFCDTYIDNNLHVTNWKRRLGCKCQYKHIVDWCGCSPNDFRIDDWPKLQATENRQLFFARKFEPVINQAIILKVEEWLYGPYAHDVVNIHSYWQSVYHYADLSPLADDALVTISTSLTRINSKNLRNERCHFTIGQVLEVTSYHSDDKFKGYVILYNVNIEDAGSVKLETWIKPRHHVQLAKASNLLKRFKSIVVSSNYDQKEQLARNFGRTLGPLSEPVVVYEFLPGEETNAFNVTFIWIDPGGNLADVNDVHIDTGHVINYVKLSVKEPHLPGVWTVILVHERVAVAHCKFLITPLEFFSGSEISQHQTNFIHLGSVNMYKNNYINSDWDFLQPSESERATLESKSLANAKRIGLDLREWIDGLTTKFFSVLGTCIVRKHVKSTRDHFYCGKLKIETCQDKYWSSFTPDPKSDLGPIEPFVL